MEFAANPFNFSTTLLIAFACWVLYIRAKAPPDTNIPLIYYGVMIYYTIMYEPQVRVPPMIIYASLVLALVLRFEFMNSAFAKFIGVLEFCGIGAIIYYCLSTIYRW